MYALQEEVPSKNRTLYFLIKENDVFDLVFFESKNEVAIVDGWYTKMSKTVFLQKTEILIDDRAELGLVDTIGQNIDSKYLGPTEISSFLEMLNKVISHEKGKQEIEDIRSVFRGNPTAAASFKYPWREPMPRCLVAGEGSSQDQKIVVEPFDNGTYTELLQKGERGDNPEMVSQSSFRIPERQGGRTKIVKR